MDLFKKCTDFNGANDAKKGGYYPYFHELSSKQGTVVTMEGHEVIMIGSNNYLGLTSHPEVIAASIEATKNYGTGVSGSRFLNGTLTIHRELEKELAEFIGKEDALSFSTGFSSNLGILSCIAGRNDVILSDRENHASIYDGCKLSYAEMIRYKHSDMQDLERLLMAVPEEKGKLIVTDGVFSMSGDICKLPEIVALGKKYGARVMVDDAHGLGVLGARGKGVSEHFGLTDEVDIIMGTFSKSLASMGGYMAAKKEVVDYVRHNSRPFIFCAAIPPSNAAAALMSLRILKREPERVARLAHIASFVRSGLEERGIAVRKTEYSAIPIIPIFTYDYMRTMKICMALFESGVYVNPVVPPATPASECLIRTSYTSEHSEELMTKAMDIIAQCLKEI